MARTSRAQLPPIHRGGMLLEDFLVPHLEVERDRLGPRLEAEVAVLARDAA